MLSRKTFWQWVEPGDDFYFAKYFLSALLLFIAYFHFLDDQFPNMGRYVGGTKRILPMYGPT